MCQFLYIGMKKKYRKSEKRESQFVVCFRLKGNSSQCTVSSTKLSYHNLRCVFMATIISLRSCRKYRIDFLENETGPFLRRHLLVDSESEFFFLLFHFDLWPVSLMPSKSKSFSQLLSEYMMKISDVVYIILMRSMKGVIEMHINERGVRLHWDGSRVFSLLTAVAHVMQTLTQFWGTINFWIFTGKRVRQYKSKEGIRQNMMFPETLSCISISKNMT